MAGASAAPSEPRDDLVAGSQRGCWSIKTEELGFLMTMDPPSETQAVNSKLIIFRAAGTAYGNSQARSSITATAMPDPSYICDLCHS